MSVPRHNAAQTAATTFPILEKATSAPQNRAASARSNNSPRDLRQRQQSHQQGNRSHGVSRRDYNYDTPIGGYSSSRSSDDETATYASRNLHYQKRRRIRHELHQKHKADAVHIRPKWTKWMNSDAKNHTVAFMGEFVGTFMFLFFAFAGTQVANIGVGDSTNQSTTGSATGFNPATLLYIALSFGFSLMVNAWVFFRISGGLFNPAVTLALALLGALSPLRAVLLFIAQISGATFSAYIVSVLFPTAFNVRTTLAVGTSNAQGLFIEAFCTAELVFTIIMLAGEKHRATFIAPIGIGLALFVSELVAVYYTGGSLNPARSFAPCAVTHDFDHEHWIYWVGPLIGTLLAVGFYKLNKILEYEMVNPGQDGDERNDPTQNPDHEIAQAVEDRAIVVEEIAAIEEAGGFDNISTDGSLNVGMMDADPAADLDAHVGSAMRKLGAGQKEDIEAQWSGSSHAAGRQLRS
ncbi:hypothetical protein QTJ16_005214 [Diplocarpon rosae]|uniref:Aquaporin n=1 Tax=Diplocarpon rosae TaxID=946125 RepID=A0AAD9SYK8_9HELO|nr:hypothetical protein QTJ16_005214 [Diplocarpon rosae]